jgi:hypothetical protein
MAYKSFTLRVGESNSTPISGGGLSIRLDAIHDTRVTLHVDSVTQDGSEHGNHSINLDTEENGPYTLHHLGLTPPPVLVLEAVRSTSADLELTWD